MDPIKDLFHFIPRFSMLQDLDLTKFSSARRKRYQRYNPPEITTPPPLNGTLRLRAIYPSVKFIRPLLRFPGGFHFRSIEKEDAREVPLQMVLDACSKTIESITFGAGHREYL